MTDTTPTPADVAALQEKPVYTQAEVDKMIKARAERIAKQAYPDYDELKVRAENADTLQVKLTESEAKSAAAETRALRSDVAARHGISAEDRDLFLTGSDEATLDAQAERLAARFSAPRAFGNVAPREGLALQRPPVDEETREKREFVAALFDQDSDYLL